MNFFISFTIILTLISSILNGIAGDVYKSFLLAIMAMLIIIYRKIDGGK